MALGGASLLAVTAAGAVLGLRRTAAPLAAPGACAVPSEVSLRMLPGAENPPVVLWGVGPVRLSVDGVPTYSPPEEPKHLAVGDHVLRAEVPGEEPLELRFRLEPFAPALFHVQVDRVAGLTLVRLGASCRSCEFPAASVQLEPAGPAGRADELEALAARALRREDWSRAAPLLRRVPRPARARPLFARLAAAVYADTLQPDRARQALELIPEGKGNNLPGLLRALDRLEETERERRAQVLLARWNKLAGAFGALVDRFGREAPERVTAKARRFEDLSQAYAGAAQARRASGQEEAIRAAEQVVRGLAAELRATRPGDCAFQADVVAALVR